MGEILIPWTSLGLVFNPGAAPGASSRHQLKTQVLGAANTKGQHSGRYRGGMSGSLAAGPSVPLGAKDLPLTCHPREERCTLLIFGGITLNLVPSSMLLRPVIKKLQDFSRNVESGSLTQSKHPATLTSHPDKISTTETQFNIRLDSPMQDSAVTNGFQSAETLGSLVPGKSAGLEGSERETSNRYTPGRDSDKDCSYNNFPLRKEWNSNSRPVPSRQPLLDFSLLKDPFFCIFVWSFLFSQLAYFIPTFHLAARAKTLGIDSMDASYLISVAGITETVSQLLSGWIADQNWIKKYHYHKTYLILCGITNLLGPLATSFPLLMVYTVSFAIFCGGYLALLLPVLVSKGSYQEVIRSLGFASFFAGIAAIAGPPIAGNISNISPLSSQ
uniref:Uncharacterized protein n=1 Tax=Gopherus agassizii TaxID=38772 RepID=A0A452HMZ3_9SAUR